MKYISFKVSDDKVCLPLVVKPSIGKTWKQAGNFIKSNMEATHCANAYWAEFADDADFSFLQNTSSVLSTAQPHAAGDTVTVFTVGA